VCLDNSSWISGSESLVTRKPSVDVIVSVVKSVRDIRGDDCDAVVDARPESWLKSAL
jgi:hypothetical protein